MDDDYQQRNAKALGRMGPSRIRKPKVDKPHPSVAEQESQGAIPFGVKPRKTAVLNIPVPLWKRYRKWTKDRGLKIGAHVSELIKGTMAR